MRMVWLSRGIWRRGATSANGPCDSQPSLSGYPAAGSASVEDVAGNYLPLHPLKAHTPARVHFDLFWFGSVTPVSTSPRSSHKVDVNFCHSPLEQVAHPPGSIPFLLH